MRDHAPPVRPDAPSSAGSHLARALRRLRGLSADYRPERHYMRGAGPACLRRAADRDRGPQGEKP